MSAPTEESDLDPVTIRYTDMQWVGPVDRVDELDSLAARPGASCFVADENAIYELGSDGWRRVAMSQSVPVDDDEDDE
ncbi:MAG: hypothetical protein EP330_14220 [Deltaproteobacteria bacterium]|nr:MAG: hypothetical protein EP330_14220 [Deltaproteobacteria bacterium]